MGLISQIFEGGAKGVFEGIGSLAKDIRIAITGKDPEKMAEIEQKLLEIEFVSQKAQTDINLEESKHPSLFVAGWRPSIGWVCSISLFMYFPVRIFIGMLMWVKIAWGATELPPMPEVGIADIIGLVFALLGLGTMRSYEKSKGVEGNR